MVAFVTDKPIEQANQLDVLQQWSRFDFYRRPIELNANVFSMHIESFDNGISVAIFIFVLSIRFVSIGIDRLRAFWIELCVTCSLVVDAAIKLQLLHFVYDILESSLFERVAKSWFDFQHMENGST